MRRFSSLPLLCLMMAFSFGFTSMAQSHWSKRVYHDTPVTLKNDKLTFLLPSPENVSDISHSLNKYINKNAISSFYVEGRAAVKGSGKQMGLNRSYWGVTIKEGSDSIKVTLRHVVDDYGDFFDKRFTRVITERNGNILCAKDFVDEFSTESGRYNTLGVSYNINTSTLTIDGGARTLESLLEIELPEVSISHPQLNVWSVGEINLSSLSVETSFDPSISLSTGWSSERLNEYFSSSNDPIEGYWEYLDRKNDPKYARLGGRYTLAVVKDLNNTDYYHILYIDGAETLSSLWNPFMIKGALKGTAFQHHYDLTWFDSTFQLIDKDIHASITDNAILTLNFPLLKTELRFSKRANY